METPIKLTITPETQVGDVYATDFSLNVINFVDYDTFVWDCGDGNTKYGSSITHYYNYPGIYTVSVSAWKIDGTISTQNTDLTVDYVLRDSILFSELPDEFAGPGIPTIKPFAVKVVSSKINEPIAITLQAINTSSIPYTKTPLTDKWDFLAPKWKFLDANKNIVTDSITLSTEPIYKNTKQIAVSGEFYFYYTDDIPTDSSPYNKYPLILMATLSTEHFQYPPETLAYPYYSYSNNKTVKTAVVWQIQSISPTNLKITENYINDIYPIKWANVPIPVMITCQFIPKIEFNVNQLSADKILSFPATNELGAKNEIVLSLTGISLQHVPSSYYRVDESPLFFKATDSSNNNTKGYIFTTITPLSPLDFDVKVVANTVAVSSLTPTSNQDFAFPQGMPIYSFGYVSNPLKGNINQIGTTTYVTNTANVPTNLQDPNIFIDLDTLTDNVNAITLTPILSTTDIINYTLSGFSSVNGMAFCPLNNRLYACDADQSNIYSFNNGTILLTSVNLTTITGNESTTPSYVSTDKQGNVWVALFDDQKILKFDRNLNFLLSAVPPEAYILPKNETGVGVGNGDMFISPPVIETDKNNDVWVCYSHHLSSLLIKFDSLGNIIDRAVDLELTSSPNGIAVDTQNNIWVSCYNTNKIQKYSSTGTLLSAISTGFLHPSNIMMDKTNNVWFTHGYNFCSVLNSNTTALSTWKIDTVSKVAHLVPSGAYTSDDVYLATRENEIWGGMTIDVFNRIWLIDSLNNNVAIFNANNKNLQILSVVSVLPRPNTNFFINNNDTFVTTVENETPIRSAQASGDWTGNRWYQKYGDLYENLILNDSSTPFRIYDLEKSFQITKVNEEFDHAKYLKSLALPEVFSQNEGFFDIFLAAVVGDGNPTTENPGRVIYERIANFISNHGDFETAEIKQLCSLCEQMSVKFNTYGIDFPVEIERLINIFSTPKSKLRGVPGLLVNLEDKIGRVLQGNDIITAEQQLIIKEKHFGLGYQTVDVNKLIDGSLSYPLSSIQMQGLPAGTTPIEHYHFFEYNPYKSLGYVQNLINWDSDFTTIPYTLSADEDWYGSEGLVEIAFNNLLTRRLFTD